MDLYGMLLEDNDIARCLPCTMYVTIELMDKDIRAALFDGFDEEGEFEELQDDFVLQVCIQVKPASLSL